jgi:hypothetical protein
MVERVDLDRHDIPFVIADETIKWEKVVKSAGLKIE